ncbi:diiron oxygenase [Chromobacterium vaccinii]|uniref:diiron oxygenase n=1 Tax=Chromobacterium vaccinii TaxID=1108595 RepID=UPI001E571757|nr:diiron oxygenase [Chromobacterium vaccinii]MCD4483866.1 diiron oxygenase [Chromobacterium vaccinii]
MSHLQNAVEKLSKYWKANAVVNNGGDPSFNVPLQPELSDFLEELLPFYGTPEWERAPYDMRQKVLSYAWVLYNHKTVYVESDLILPVCEDIIKGRYQLERPELIQEIIAQAMVDEAVHTQMSINAANAILKFRGLPIPSYDGFFLTRQREFLLEKYKSDHDKRLVSLGIACASETLVTDYLDKIAKAKLIQPLCQKITEAHANDELVHSSVFTLVLESVIAFLNEREKRIVASSIYEAINMFANKELDVWHCVLKQLNFPEFLSMIAAANGEPDVSVYTAGVQRLLQRTNMLDGFVAA